MGREQSPLIRGKSNETITIDIYDIWRNPDIQDQVIKEVKKLSKNRNNK